MTNSFIMILELDLPLYSELESSISSSFFCMWYLSIALALESWLQRFYGLSVTKCSWNPQIPNWMLNGDFVLTCISSKSKSKRYLINFTLLKSQNFTVWNNENFISQKIMEIYFLKNVHNVVKWKVYSHQNFFVKATI